jgi:hypothetical protein
MPSNVYEDFLRDLVYLLRHTGAEAQRKGDAEASDFERGRALAYVEILSLMQHQADSFMIPRDPILLSGFDPVNDPLDPPRPT